MSIPVEGPALPFSVRMMHAHRFASPMDAPQPTTHDSEPLSSEAMPDPAPGSGGAPDHPPPSLLLLVGVAGASLAADLVSKWWAYVALSGWDGKRMAPRRIEVIDGYFAFLFAQNPGGAWSFLRGWSDGVRRPFFLFVSSAAIVFIVTLYRRLHASQRSLGLGLAFALGGALGNLVDRIRYGWVIDFIAVYVKSGGREVHWPTFNVADIAIVVGVLLMAKDMLFPKKVLLEGGRPSEELPGRAGRDVA
jgi:signal peptidase II